MLWWGRNSLQTSSLKFISWNAFSCKLQKPVSSWPKQWESIYPFSGQLKSEEVCAYRAFPGGSVAKKLPAMQGCTQETQVWYLDQEVSPTGIRTKGCLGKEDVWVCSSCQNTHWGLWGLNSRSLCSHSLGGWKSKTKVPTDLVPGVSSLPGLKTDCLLLTVSSCARKKETERGRELSDISSYVCVNHSVVSNSLQPHGL